MRLPQVIPKADHVSTVEATPPKAREPYPFEYSDLVTSYFKALNNPLHRITRLTDSLS